MMRHGTRVFKRLLVSTYVLTLAYNIQASDILFLEIPRIFKDSTIKLSTLIIGTESQNFCKNKFCRILFLSAEIFQKSIPKAASIKEES